MKPWIKILLIFSIIIPCLIFGFKDMALQMGIWAAIGLVVTFIINFEKIETFTISTKSVQAKMREADQLIKDVNATLEDLKKTTEPLMAYNLAHMVRGHTFIGISAIDKEALYKKIKTLIKDLNINEDRINELLEQAVIEIKRQYPNDILAIIEKNHGYNKFIEILDIFKTLYNEYEIIELDDLKKVFIDNPSIDNDEIQHLISRYNDFLNSV